MTALRPLVPGVEEDDSLVFRFVENARERDLQPLLIALGPVRSSIRDTLEGMLKVVTSNNTATFRELRSAVFHA